MRRRHALMVCILILLAIPWLGLGLKWGLPSHRVDPFLFGDQPVWSGQKIYELAGGWEERGDLGADVAEQPLGVNDTVWVNQTDAQKAQIMRRWRLYTAQPDEASTLRALAGMNPSQGKLDPKLYQYGGLWIYPVGGLIAAAGKMHAITVVRDVPYYLEHPEAIGRFYLVARIYSLAWGLVGVVVVYGLVWRLTRGMPGVNDVGRLWLAALAAVIYFTMPGIVNMAHEAKPHLAGLVLVLAAIWAGTGFADRPTWRRAIWLGVLCGAAVGMVLTGWVAFVVLLALLFIRPGMWRRIIAAGVIGVIVYAITNPYVPINLVRNRAVLASNLGTSVGMYSGPGTTLSFGRTAILCIAEGAAPSTAIIGLVGVIALLPAARRRSIAWVLVAPVGVALIQFICLADHKPMEYARFGLLIDVGLAIAAICAVARSQAMLLLRSGALMGLLVAAALFGSIYVWEFAQDAHDAGTRQIMANFLKDDQGGTLGVWADPAPYCMPPVDLFHWKILRLGHDVTGPEATRQAQVLIFAAGLRQADPIDAIPAGQGHKIQLPSRPRAKMSWASPGLQMWQIALPGTNPSP